MLTRATATLALVVGCGRASTPRPAGPGAKPGTAAAAATSAPAEPACDAWLAALIAAEITPLPPCAQEVDLDGDGQLDRLFVVSRTTSTSGELASDDGDDGDDGDGAGERGADPGLVLDLMVELAGSRPVLLGSAGAPLWEGELGEPERHPRPPDASGLSWLEAWRPAVREGLYLVVGSQRFAVPGRGGAVWVSSSDAAALLVREGRRWVLLGLGY